MLQRFIHTFVVPRTASLYNMICNKYLVYLVYMERTMIAASLISFDLVCQMERRHRKKELPAQASMHHLFVQMKGLMSASLGEELEVFLFIYDSRESRPIRHVVFTTSLGPQLDEINLI